MAESTTESPGASVARSIRQWWGGPMMPSRMTRRVGTSSRLRRWRKRTYRSFAKGHTWSKKWVGVQVGAVVLVAAILGVALWVVSQPYDAWSDIAKGIYIEATGLLMDVLVVGVIIGVITRRFERKLRTQNQEELIEDFKKWESQEARHQIAGAIRRLNSLGKTSIDFAGIRLRRFSFREHDIPSIAGSKFHSGSAKEVMSNRRKTVLEGVSFSYIDCRKVAFAQARPFGGSYALFRDCQFVRADLRGALFKGARIEWTETPPAEIMRWEESPEGERYSIPTHTSPFEDADLAGMSFEHAEFRNADFRRAKNLEECKFAGASGLEGCVFDSNDRKEWALRQAARQGVEQSGRPRANPEEVKS